MKKEMSCDQIFEKLIHKDDKLIFNILIDYSKIFGADISFKLKDGKVYKNFVEYTIGRGEYLKSLDYHQPATRRQSSELGRVPWQDE